MTSIDEPEAQAHLDEVLEEAQRQPIMIRRQGQDTAVVVSIANYERLRALDIQAFLALRSEIATEAIASGLTRHSLAKLIRDEG